MYLDNLDHNTALLLEHSRRSELKREFLIGHGRTERKFSLRSTMSGWDYRWMLWREVDAPRPRFRLRKGY